MRKFAFLIFLFPAVVLADTPVTLIRVLDGDTIEVSAAVWPSVQITTKLRIHGIDTPETRTRNLCEKEKGLAAKKYLADYLAGKDLKVENIQNGKYSGRVLGDLKADGVDIAVMMISSGYAREYFGGKRGAWCIQ